MVYRKEAETLLIFSYFHLSFQIYGFKLIFSALIAVSVSSQPMNSACGYCPVGTECMPSGSCGYPVLGKKRSVVNHNEG